MSLTSKLIQDIEDVASNLSATAAASDIAAAIASAEAGVIPLRRIRGHFEVIRASGGWSRESWSHPARNAAQVTREHCRFSQAQAVGVVFANGQRFLIDPDTRLLIRFVEFVDGSFNR